MKKRMKYSLATLIGISAMTMGSAHAFGGPHGYHNGMGFGGCQKHRFWNSDDCQTQMKERLDEAKQKIEITDGQEPAWQRFSEMLTAEAEKHQKQMETMRNSNGSGQNMDQRIAIMEERLEGMKQVAQAYKDLEAVLDDDQKATVEKMMQSRRGWR